ncbi:MAG TPA: hypothetical protein VMH33_11425 [Solirubrobacterales bacterium]|nr:hypothetical protein [Solirubrobacterales bacterium]
MRIVERANLVEGGFERNTVWKRACADIETGIARTDWPWESGSFTLNPDPRETDKGKDRHPNGVKPIKVPMIRYLSEVGWQTEALPDLPVGFEGQDVLGTGDIDALLCDDDVYVGLEWETGNISSSHRAINKLLDGIGRGTLAAGVLVVPMRETARYLTDRVGNFEELAPYFEFWAKFPMEAGVLRIYGVAHDELDPKIPYIPKGRDGRALG